MNSRNIRAEPVIAVDLGKHQYDETRKPGFCDIANDSLSIMQHQLALRDTASADMVIDIKAEGESWYDFANARSKIQAWGRGGQRACAPDEGQDIREE
jgi:Zn-dependent alcohol dehydrogenase